MDERSWSSAALSCCELLTIPKVGWCRSDGLRAYGWDPGSTLLSVLFRGGMVSWCVLVQDRHIGQFTSRIWTVSLPNPTHRNESNDHRFEVPRAAAAPPTEPAQAPRGPDRSRLVLRAVYITNVMLEKHGHTGGCSKCRAIQRRQSQTTLGHTSERRKRMEKLRTNDIEYQYRLEQASERLNHYLAEELEISDMKRMVSPSETVTDQSMSDSNEMDQDMADCSPQSVLAKARPPQMQCHRRS